MKGWWSLGGGESRGSGNLGVLGVWEGGGLKVVGIKGVTGVYG